MTGAQSREPGSPARAALGAAVLALAFLIPRTAPGVTFEDAGELAAAASCWGVPHPPGYPLWMLVAAPMAHLASWIGLDPARALVLLSATCAAGTCALLARLASKWGASTTVAVLAGLLPLAAPTFTSQALIVEVYALAAFVQVAALSVALAPRPRSLRVGVLFGLGLCAHASTLLLAPVAAIAAWRGARFRGLALASAGGVAGLLPFVYVPLAAAADPAVNWGDARTGQRLLEHLTRQGYAGDGGALGPRIQFVLEQALLQWPAIAALALVLALWLGRRGVGAAMVGSLAATLVLGAVIGVLAVPYDVTPLALRTRIAPTFIPLVLLVSTLGGTALIALEQRLRARAGAATAPLLVAAALALAQVPAPSVASGAVRMSRADGAQRYLRETLEACPPDAILVLNRMGFTDILGFPVLYGQVALGLRPDVTAIDRALLTTPWYREQLAGRAPDLAPAILALGNTYGADPERFGDPRQARLASAEFLQTVFDGPRPVVLVERPGANVLRGRPITPNERLWFVGAPPPPEPEPVGPAWAWLAGQPADPWTEELSGLAAERDLARAEALRAAGREADADRLEAVRR
ncbi:DUF2723 domain-containing protein [Engelhardtia mirabilis]|uniref:DUF2723 domain-containing protein n=1 Tax=Engelhardtia mirabilis TaxID=2528011 RepID=A0A518BJ01_9BACT|nr:hypothetical protein Pla133_20350 [Planctomycetes bacterium Pla133]QDV01287.1 hypothetical protein Pla86_20360 [Planctomycetes bacterium Pla86]